MPEWLYLPEFADSISAADAEISAGCVSEFDPWSLSAKKSDWPKLFITDIARREWFALTGTTLDSSLLCPQAFVPLLHHYRDGINADVISSGLRACFLMGVYIAFYRFSSDCITILHFVRKPLPPFKVIR